MKDTVIIKRNEEGMLAFRKAIDLAVEGGYKKALIENMGKCKALSLFCTDTFLLDPDFWRCLGKAMGWPDFTIEYDFPTESWDAGNERIVHGSISKKTETWKYYWHSLIDHLALGKSPEDFFTALLKPKK